MFESSAELHYLVDVRDGVLRLTFNRPEHGNAMPPTAIPGLVALFKNAQADASIRCVLVAGKGKIFSAGGDVGSFAKSLQQDVGERRADFGRRMRNLAALVEAVAAFDRPVIAAIRGAVAGAGLLYPLIADYAIGDESATFVFAHQKVGLSPDAGVSYFLPQAVGTRMARTLLLGAAKLDAGEARRIGILTEVVAAEKLEAEVELVARRFAAAPQRAVVAAKRLLQVSGNRTLAEQLEAEANDIVECVSDPDFAEGVTAFLEKRRAHFPSARNVSA
jgi:2-(1,2-epoxy-1,2-dihydrophenyl)acetyl-CoA isomerase